MGFPFKAHIKKYIKVNHINYEEHLKSWSVSNDIVSENTDEVVYEVLLFNHCDLDDNIIIKAAFDLNVLVKIKQYNSLISKVVYKGKIK